MDYNVLNFNKDILAEPLPVKPIFNLPNTQQENVDGVTDENISEQPVPNQPIPGQPANNGLPVIGNEDEIPSFDFFKMTKDKVGKIPRKIRKDFFLMYEEADQQLKTIRDQINVKLKEKYDKRINYLTSAINVPPRQLAIDGTPMSEEEFANLPGVKEVREKVNKEYDEEFQKEFEQLTSGIYSGLIKKQKDLFATIPSARRASKTQARVVAALTDPGSNLGFSYFFDDDENYNNFSSIIQGFVKKGDISSPGYLDAVKKRDQYLEYWSNSAKAEYVERPIDQQVYINGVLHDKGAPTPQYAVRVENLKEGDNIRVPNGGAWLYWKDENGDAHYNFVNSTARKFYTDQPLSQVAIDRIAPGEDKRGYDITQGIPDQRIPYLTVGKQGKYFANQFEISKLETPATQGLALYGIGENAFSYSGMTQEIDPNTGKGVIDPETNLPKLIPSNEEMVIKGVYRSPKQIQTDLDEVNNQLKDNPNDSELIRKKGVLERSYERSVKATGDRYRFAENMTRALGEAVYGKNNWTKIKDQIRFEDVLSEQWDLYSRQGIFPALMGGTKSGKHNLTNLAYEYINYLKTDDNWKNVNTFSAENLQNSLYAFSQSRVKNIENELNQVKIDGIPFTAFASTANSVYENVNEQIDKFNKTQTKLSSIISANYDAAKNGDKEALRVYTSAVKTYNNNINTFNKNVVNNPSNTYYLQKMETPEFTENMAKLDEIDFLKKENYEMLKKQQIATEDKSKEAEGISMQPTGNIFLDGSATFLTSFINSGLSFVNSVVGLAGQAGSYIGGAVGLDGGARGSDYWAAATQTRDNEIDRYTRVEMLPENNPDGTFSFKNNILNLINTSGAAGFDLVSTLLAPEVRLIKGASAAAKYVNRFPGLFGVFTAGHFYDEWENAERAGMKGSSKILTHIVAKNLIQTGLENLVNVKDIFTEGSVTAKGLRSKFNGELNKVLSETAGTVSFADYGTAVYNTLKDLAPRVANFALKEFGLEENGQLFAEELQNKVTNAIGNYQFDEDVFNIRSAIENIGVGLILGPLTLLGGSARAVSNRRAETVYALVDEYGYDKVYNSLLDLRNAKLNKVQGSEKIDEKFVNSMLKELPISLSLKKPEGISDVKWLSIRASLVKKEAITKQMKSSPESMRPIFQSQIDQLDAAISTTMSTSDEALTEAFRNDAVEILKDENGVPYFSKIQESQQSTKESTQAKTISVNEESAQIVKDILADIYRNVPGGRNSSILEEGFGNAPSALNRANSVGGNQYSAHGMGKSSVASAFSDLYNLLTNGIDPNRGGGRLYTAPLSGGEAGAGAGIGTASGNAYMDGPFTLVANRGIGAITDVSQIGGIIVNDGLVNARPELLNSLREAFPNIIFESTSNTDNLVKQLNEKYATQESTGPQQEGGTEGRVTEYAPAQQGEQVQAPQPATAPGYSDISGQGQVVPATDAKADIERRRQEEKKEYSLYDLTISENNENSYLSQGVKNLRDSARKVLIGKEYTQAQKLIQSWIDSGLTLEEVGNKLNERFNVTDISAGSKEVFAERKNNSINAKYDAELAALEGGVKPAQPSVQAQGTTTSGDISSQGQVAPGKKLFNEPNPDAAVIENQFKVSKGIDTPEPARITSLDENKSKTIADAYDQLIDNPNDPEVRSAYQAMADETMDQFDATSKAGVKVEVWTGEGEPYKNSAEMIADVRDNKHMYIFSTEAGFGENKITDEQRQQNAMLRDSGVKDVNGKPLLINDIFRFVHDYFGHTRLGNSFGAIGEENAWNVHARMYSPLARRAMTTETRGQNSWVNFNKSLRNPDGSMKKKGDEGYIPPASRPFAPQKMGLLPEEFSNIEEAYSVQSSVQPTVQPEAVTPTVAPTEVAPTEVTPARQLTEQESTRMSDARTMTPAEFSAKYPDVSPESIDMIKKSGFDNEQDFDNWQAEQVSKANQVASQIRDSLFTGKADMNILSHALHSSWSKIVPGLSMVWDNYASNVEKAGYPEAYKDYAGFYDPATKTVYINPDKMGLDTPIHEFGHVWYAVANIVDKNLTKRGRDLIRGTEYEARVRAMDEYKDLEPEEIEEEALVLAIGERGAQIIDQVRRNNFLTWLSDLFNLVANKFGVDIKIDNLSLGEFLDFAAMDILSGGNVLINSSSPVEVEASGVKPSIVSAERYAVYEPRVKPRLDTAKRMQAEGAESSDIWEQTGMENIDGKWFSELDYNAKISIDMPKAIEEMDRKGEPYIMLPIAKMFSYPEFFKVYPDARKIRVKISRYNDDYIAAYNHESKIIRLNIDPEAYEYVGGDYTSSILHEIQHHIQKVDKTDVGANIFQEFENAKGRIANTYERSGFTADANTVRSIDVDKSYTGKDLDFYNKIMSAAEFSYLTSKGEIQARNVEKRFVNPQKRQYAPTVTQDKVRVKASVKSVLESNPYSKFMTEDKDSYYFFHWSNDERKIIDPNKFGNNRITSREERIARPSAAFFYTRPDFREMGVGDYGHVVKVPKDKVYPATADPLNFFDEAKSLFEKSHPGMAFGPNQQIGWITKVANAKGYEMVVAKWGKQLRAETTKKVKPEWYARPVGWATETNPKYANLKKGSVKLSVASKYNVEEVRSNVKQGSKISKGLAVYTRGGQKIIEGTSDLSLDYVKTNAPDVFISNANIISKYPIVSGIKQFGTISTIEDAQEAYDIFSNQIADNLQYLISEFSPEFRDISTLWYDGANIIAQNFSSKYGVSIEQAAGIIASLSPQKDWYQNVRLAEMVMMSFQENPLLTKSMIDKQRDIIKEGEKAKVKEISKAQNKYNKKRTKENAENLKKKKEALVDYNSKANKVVSMIESFVGKRLNEIPDHIKPYVVRLSNELNTTKDYDILSPDGRVIGVAMKKDGKTKSKVAWGSYTEIGKAVAIFIDGSQDNINRSLGQMHKIRNFYNNIADPMSSNNDVTMDTHAVAAALLQPLSGNSKEVGQNFGTGTSNSGPFGIKGLYYAYAEGYKKAAERYGMLPRQIQSITWEAVRGLFTDTFKTKTDNVSKIKSIWSDYSNNKIDINETRRQINEFSGGIKDPTWAEQTTDGRGSIQGQLGDGSKEGSVGRGAEVSRRADVGVRPGGSRGGGPILEVKPSISSRYGLDDKWADRAINEARTMLNNGMFQITENTATGPVGFTLSVNGNVHGVYASMQEAEDQRDNIIKATIMKGYPQVSEMVAQNILFNAKRKDFTKPLNPSAVQGIVPSVSSRGYVGDTRTRSQKIKDATKRFFRKYFTFSKGLPKEITLLKEAMGGKLSYQVSLADSMVKDLKKVAKKIGFEDWATFDQALRDYRTYNPTNPFWVGGQPGYSPAANTNPAFFNLPVEIREYVVSMRALLDGMSEQLVRNGLVSPDMALTLESNMGKYVHRSYALFTMGDEWSKKVRNNKKVIDTAHENLFQLYYAHLTATNPNMSQQEIINQANEEADKEINRILDSKKPFFGRDEASFLPYRNTGSLKQRQEQPQWLRDLLGEYTDPGTAFLLSVGETATLLHTSDYLAKLRDFGLGTVFFEEGNRPADANYRIGSMGQMLKPLEGLYTTKEMYDLLTETDNNRSSNLKWVWRLMNLNKMMKTVFSPVTQTKNFVSNTGFAMHNGYFDVTAMSDAWGYFRRQIVNNKSQDVLESLKPLFERGVLNQSLTAKELSEIFRTNDFEQYVLDNADKTGVQDYLSDPGKLWRATNRGASRIYQASDDFWKIYAYYNEQRGLSKVIYNKDYESLTQSEKDNVDNQSADRIMNVMPTYDRILEIFKTISKTGVIGNFIAFRAEVFRVMANSYSYAYNDIVNGIKDKNPRMVAYGSKRLLGIASYNAIRMEGIYLLAKLAGKGVAGLASSLWGGGDDEDKEKMAINSFVADWAISDDKIYDTSKIKDGIIEYYTFSSVDPYATIYNIFNAYKYGNEYDASGGPIAASLEIVVPFAELEMTIAAFMSAYKNKDAYGFDIYNRDDKLPKKFLKGTWYVTKQTVTPGAFTWINRMFYRRNDEGKIEFGFNPSELTTALIGARPYVANIGRKWASELSSAYNDVFDDASGDFKMYDKENKSYEDIGNERYNLEILRLHKIYTDAIRLGYPKDKLLEYLRSSRMDRRTMIAIVTGETFRAFDKDGKIGRRNPED